MPGKKTVKMEMENMLKHPVVQRVTRARVDYEIELTAEDEAPVSVFARTLELRDANVWHPQEIDLTPWAGRRVRLTLVTRPSAGTERSLAGKPSVRGRLGGPATLFRLRRFS